MKMVLVAWFLMPFTTDDQLNTSQTWTPVDVATYDGRDAITGCRFERDYLQQRANPDYILFECLPHPDQQ